MSILDALKNLVIKRGGTPKGSNIAEVIDDLAEIQTPLEPSVSEIPKPPMFVTFTDYGESVYGPGASYNKLKTFTDAGFPVVMIIPPDDGVYSESYGQLFELNHEFVDNDHTYTATFYINDMEHYVTFMSLDPDAPLDVGLD